jgi:hypothetical protein
VALGDLNSLVSREFGHDLVNPLRVADSELPVVQGAGVGL